MNIFNFRIQTVKKNIFTNHRLFTIKTEPGSKIVNRTREDFRWLTKRLKEEFPTATFYEIEKGSLSKRILEDYFDNLMNLKGVFHSRFLRYFLSANDVKFAKRRDRDLNWLNNLAKKFSVDEEFEIKKLKLDEENDLMVISV